VQLHEEAMASCLLLKYRWKLGGKNPGKGLAQKRKSRKKGNFRSVVWAGGDMPKRGKEKGAAATQLAVASLGRRNYQFKCHAMPKHFMRN